MFVYFQRLGLTPKDLVSCSSYCAFARVDLHLTMIEVAMFLYMLFWIPLLFVPVPITFAQYSITAALIVSIVNTTADNANNSVTLSTSIETDSQYSTYQSCLNLASAWKSLHATMTSIWSHTAYRGKDPGLRCATYMSDGGHSCTSYPLPSNIVTETEYVVPNDATYKPPAACCERCFLDASNVQALYSRL